jgi:hypothetical protein
MVVVVVIVVDGAAESFALDGFASDLSALATGDFATGGGGGGIVGVAGEATAPAPVDAPDVVPATGAVA